MIHKLPKHGRSKPKYNTTPTQQERAYHLWLMERKCVCGCGRQSTIVHHPLQRHPAQRWRRDHEYVVPMWWECHDRLHKRDGSDEYADEAARYRQLGREAGLL
jgi:hypothetical protein